MAIITGAGSGIGKATKELLRQRGNIFYTLHTTAGSEEMPEYFISCDLRKRAAIKEAIEKVFNTES